MEGLLVHSDEQPERRHRVATAVPPRRHRGATATPERGRGMGCGLFLRREISVKNSAETTIYEWKAASSLALP